MVKVLNINVFHGKSVSRFYTQNLEHSCSPKKEHRENFLIFYGEPRNWNTPFVTIGMPGA
jgi:hypothetical protein